MQYRTSLLWMPGMMILATLLSCTHQDVPLPADPSSSPDSVKQKDSPGQQHLSWEKEFQ